MKYEVSDEVVDFWFPGDDCADVFNAIISTNVVEAIDKFIAEADFWIDIRGNDIGITVASFERPGDKDIFTIKTTLKDIIDVYINQCDYPQDIDTLTDFDKMFKDLAKHVSKSVKRQAKKIESDFDDD